MDILDEKVGAAEITDAFIPKVEKSWLDGFQATVNNISLTDLERAISSFDLQEAEEISNVGEWNFSELEMLLAVMWLTTSIYTYRGFSSVRKIATALRQDAKQNDELQQLATRLLSDLASEQRGAVRSTILSGYSLGKRPREIALDIAGRYDPVSKKRIGGLIGLNNLQADAYNKLDLALRTGDKEDLKTYLKWKTRDSRFDAWVRDRLAGNPLSLQKRETILARYADRAIHLRAKGLADDITRVILATSQHSAINTQIRAGVFKASDLTKVWHTMEDQKVRFSHVPLDKKEVPYDDYYISGRGVPMLHPHDSNAPLSERAGCRCWQEYRLAGKRIGRSGFRAF